MNIITFQEAVRYMISHTTLSHWHAAASCDGTRTSPSTLAALEIRGPPHIGCHSDTLRCLPKTHKGCSFLMCTYKTKPMIKNFTLNPTFFKEYSLHNQLLAN